MIDLGLLEAYKRQLEAGTRLRTAVQLDLVNELTQLQIAFTDRSSDLEKRNVKLELEIRALRVQLSETNRTISILNRRGDRTAGTYDQGAPVPHGTLHEWPTEQWGSLAQHESEGGITCDWGWCGRIAKQARFDAHGHGWLPVCDECAALPV